MRNSIFVRDKFRGTSQNLNINIHTKKVAKDKTTYTVPEADGPRMASEPAVAYGGVTERYGS
jgi:hypothetical protein